MFRNYFKAAIIMAVMITAVGAAEPDAVPVTPAASPAATVSVLTLASLATEIDKMKALIKANTKEKIAEFIARYVDPRDLEQGVKEVGSLDKIIEGFITDGKSACLAKLLAALDLKHPAWEEGEGSRTDEPKPNRAIIDGELRTITFMTEHDGPIVFKLSEGRWYMKN